MAFTGSLTVASPFMIRQLWTCGSSDDEKDRKVAVRKEKDGSWKIDFTGRRSKMKTDESLHDAFGVGHSSTSISAGLGMAVGRDLLGKKNYVIAIIGDGAMTAGQAYEAMNNCGFLDSNLIILNDNNQVSLPTAIVDGPANPVGALSSALTKLQIVMAPMDEAELMHMVATAVQIDDRPSCFRYPRGNGIGVPLPPDSKGIPIEIGKGRLMIEGERVAILGYVTMVQTCLRAAASLKEHGVTVTVADGRFCKSLDTELIRMLTANHEILITVEEGSVGGFDSHVTNYLCLSGLLDGNLKVRSMELNVAP